MFQQVSGCFSAPRASEGEGDTQAGTWLREQSEKHLALCLKAQILTRPPGFWEAEKNLLERH